MANQSAKIDVNSRKTLLAVTDDSNAEIRRLLVDPTTGRLKVTAIITAMDAIYIADGSVSNAEFETLDGVTSGIQGQLNAKVNLDQTVAQTIGNTTNRLLALWATDVAVTNTITGSISGNAGTVTNGVYITGNQSIAGIKTFSDATEASNATTGGTVISGGLAVAKRVYSTDMTVTNKITGSISGNCDGNAGTVTGGVYTTGNQSIAGIKTFSDATEASNATTGGTVVSGGLAVAKRVYATDMTVTNKITGSISGNSDGNAGTATKLAATKNINEVAFDGSADITVYDLSTANWLNNQIFN